MNRELRLIYELYKAAELDAFKGKDMPSWIKDSPAFNNKKNIKKVFPTFGLKNFREKVDVVPETSTAAPIAIQAIDAITNTFWDNIKIIDGGIKRLFIEPIANAEEKKALRKKYDEFQTTRANLGFILREFEDATNKNSVVRQPDGKVKILLQQDVSDVNGKVIGRVNEPMFRVYEKIKKIIEEFGKTYGISITIGKLDDFSAIKEFNKKNLPLGKTTLEVVFSAENDGAWDLATMSMRGIETCQSWGGEMDACLIGSIISKYVGIIYLTSGKDFAGRGNNMIKRCIVRFGINTKNKTPVILIDRMFDSYDARIAKLFIESLQKRTSLKVLNYAINFADRGDMSATEVMEQMSLPHPSEIKIPEEESQKFDESYKADRSYKDTSFRMDEKNKELPSDKELVDDTIDSMVGDARLIISAIKLPVSKIKNEITERTLKPIYIRLTQFIRKNNIKNTVLMGKVLLKELIKKSDMIANNIEHYSKDLDLDEVYSEEEYGIALRSYWKQVKDISVKLLKGA